MSELLPPPPPVTLSPAPVAGLSALAQLPPVPAFTRWYQIYRGLTVLGIVGFAGLTLPVMEALCGYERAWSPIGALVSVMVVLALAAAAYSESAWARLVTCGCGSIFVVAAILGLWPIAPMGAWEPTRFGLFTYQELLWRVAIGPTAFAFCGLAAVAWCGEELTRLGDLTVRRQAEEGPPEPLALPGEPAWRLRQNGDMRDTVLRLMTAAPMLAFGLFGLAMTTNYSSDYTPPLSDIQPVGLLLVGVVEFFLLFGLYRGSPRARVLSCGASAGLCLGCLAEFGANLVEAIRDWAQQNSLELVVLCTPIVVLVTICLVCAICAVRVVIPTLLPRKRRVAVAKEEDLGTSQRWDEAPRGK